MYPIRSTTNEGRSWNQNHTSQQQQWDSAYQVLDQTGSPMQVAGMTPQEDVSRDGWQRLPDIPN